MKTHNVQFVRPYSGNGGARFNLGEQASFSEKVVKDLLARGVAKLVPLPGDERGEDMVKQHETKDVPSPPKNKMIDQDREEQQQKQRPKLNR